MIMKKDLKAMRLIVGKKKTKQMVSAGIYATVLFVILVIIAKMMQGKMTYLVTDNCIKCKHTDCVAVCPVDCFYEADNFLAINPDECIDCGVCVPECPVDAIVADHELQPEAREKWDEINRRVSEWNVNIIDQKTPLEDAEKWEHHPNKYEEFGIIPVKDIT